MSDHQPDLEPSIPTPIEFDFAAFEARRAAQRDDFLQKLVPLKAGLFAVLKSHGIIRVTAVFDGCGDSGQIDEMSAFNAEGPTEFPKGGIHLVDAAPELNGENLAQSVSDAIETWLMTSWKPITADGRSMMVLMANSSSMLRRKA